MMGRKSGESGFWILYEAQKLVSHVLLQNTALLLINSIFYGLKSPSGPLFWIEVIGRMPVTLNRAIYKPFHGFSTILNEGNPAGTHIQIIWEMP